MIIDKFVGMPKARENYRFADMEVGDSAFFEGQTSQGKAMKAATAHGNYHGKKFSARSVDGGVRIWRMA